MPDQEQVLTIKETAVLLKMSERTVYLMAKDGRLPGAVKLGGSWRVVQDKLLAWLDANSSTGSEPTGEPADG